MSGSGTKEIPFVGSKLWSWVAVVLGIGLMAGLTALSGSTDEAGAPRTLPLESESMQVRELSEQFSEGDALPAIALFVRDDGAALSGDQITELQPVTEALVTAAGPEAEQASPPVPLDDSSEAWISTILLPADVTGLDLSDIIADMREAGANDLPEGVDLYVTGPAGFAGDTASAFDGANFRLLAISAAVVAVLLILTYRSPVLWLVPLISVALADRAAAATVGLVAEYTPLEADGSTTGILSVLVFGAGTNYALLLISRYREELRVTNDHRQALSTATRAARPAIIASNITVVVALLALLLATVPSYRDLGASLAIGLLIALGYALIFLPAALAICGPKLFWPFIPKAGDNAEKKSPWHTVAEKVSTRPAIVLVVMMAVLIGLAAGAVGTSVGLSTTEQFRTESEAADGQFIIEDRGAAGELTPITVIAPTSSTDQVAQAIESVNGTQMRGEPSTSEDGSLVQFTVFGDYAPSSSEAFEQITDLREAVHGANGDAVVGGTSAESLDERDGTYRDTLLIIPLILAAVLILLMVILRSVLAPVLLVCATALSSAAALGLGAWVSTNIFGFPALDISVPLYSLIFLIALGIDYTMFLVLRAREERPEYGTRDGMVRAVGLTGAVITSAGLVLASVFAVLGVLPLITLGQVGIVVGLGILLDTFLVRTLVVPSLFSLMGDKMWWPSKPTDRSNQDRSDEVSDITA
ncbi:MMPL family transporter [Corynebacterium sputi]|uniref:MMPL family transporter n=1 Tax=Corynebacterium sputi TaxID=489915 RepID=UPI000401B7B1|nr:MMPL family transporter [Corynebacterium sputi]